MNLKRLCAWALVAVAPLLFGSPASAEIHDYVHSGTGITISGVWEVGQTLTISGTPTGATCQMLRSGSAIPGATSCTSYTVVAADVSAGANALKLQVTTAGYTAFAALSISGSCATTGAVGTAYGGCVGIAASGGASPYTYALSGAWPAGLSIAPSTGAVSGTPTTGGSYPNLSVAAIDSVGGSASIAQFTLVVSGGGGGGSPSLDFSQASNSQYLAIF